MDAKFVISVAQARKLPSPAYPEIAFVGRSNVGKSALINKVLNRKNLVKVGKTPGKTRLLNFFNIEDSAMFVDMPGYGYAKVSQAERANWARLIDSYLMNRKNLLLCILLVDIRRSFGEEERSLVRILTGYGVAVRVVLTKADKFSKAQMLANRVRLATEIGVKADELIVFSAMTGLGLTELRGAISEYVALNWS
ncbi:ribosome biogenesis GTP-binding protein YihA/YsxC [Deferribacterales bacterium RsTz2092]|nr:GTP-binding protein [Deferribacterales bacterium]